jgi:hydrogenase nickel incorporation protein HypB
MGTHDHDAADPTSITTIMGRRRLHFGTGPAGTHVAGLSQARLIEIETDIMSKNDRYAAENRAFFKARQVLAVNLVSSPGSGKTTLLCRPSRMLGDQPLAVIEGDQQTANDADRIRATGAPAVQVNTGKGCHLDGHMVGHAVEDLNLRPRAFCSSRMSATSSAPRVSTSARTPRWRSCRSPRARTSR